MLYARDFHMNVISAAFPSYMYIEKAAKMMFVWKMRAYDVDEIDILSIIKKLKLKLAI